MLVRHGSPPAVDVGANPAHILIHCINGPAPVGMLARASPHRSVIPGGGCRRLTISCGTDSLLSSKSPIRHSPKAIVFEVPSVMALMVIACEPSVLKPPPNLNIP